MGILDFSPFKDDPTLLPAIGLALVGLACLDMASGGKLTAMINGRVNPERAMLREGIYLDKGGKIVQLSSVRFMAERMVKNGKGTITLNRAEFRDISGGRHMMNDESLAIPMTALTAGVDVILRPKEDEVSIFAHEREDYERRIAALEADRSLNYLNAFELGSKIAVHAGNMRKQLGLNPPMIMRPGQKPGEFTGEAEMPQGGESA